jgi:hypothetical protein
VTAGRREGVNIVGILQQRIIDRVQKRLQADPIQTTVNSVTAVFRTAKAALVLMGQSDFPNKEDFREMTRLIVRTAVS